MVCAALLISARSSLKAEDLFSATAMTVQTPPGQGPVSATDSAGNFITLVKDVADTRSQLNLLANTDFTGHLRYAGVENAIGFTVDLLKVDAQGRPLQQTAMFTFANGHAPAMFSEATDSALKDDIVRYFRQEGTSILSSFNSTVGVSDGNPNAASATAADATFTAFGTGSVNRPDLDFSFFNPLNIDISSFRSGDFDGYRISVPIGITYHVPQVLDGRLSLQLTGLFSYINIDDAEVYQGGLFLGAPIKIIRPHRLSATSAKDDKGGKEAPIEVAYSPLSWTITPNGGAVVSGSLDFAQGGIIYLGGLTSALSYRLTDRFTVTLGDGFSVAEGGTLSVGDYRFDDQTDQVILKNGLNLSYQLNDTVALEGQAVATDFVNSAAIPAYATFALQTVFNVPLGHSGQAAFVTRIGFITDQAPDYHSYGGRVSLGLSF